MATVQVRDLPEEVYETIRRRARAEGRSLQSYLRERLVEFASQPTQQELVAEIEQRLAEQAEGEPDPSQIADDVDAERR